MEDCFTFNYGELPSCCFRKFQDMKKRSEFCDITIRYGDHFITAHRLVLAAAIPYFADLLGGKENTRKTSEISVEEIDASALESLIEFAYTCQVKITSDNAKDVFSAACILKIDEVRDACCKFMAERLNPDNALFTRELAESFSCSVLLESVDNYICHNFDKLAETQDFLNSSFACVQRIVGRDDLQCSEESNVFDFVIKWVKTSPEERKTCLPQLLQKIRLSFLSPEYLTYHVAKEEFIRTSIECRDIVDDAKIFHFLPNHKSEISSFVTTPRTVLKKNNHSRDLIPGIYAVSRSTVLSVQHFDVKTGEWAAQKTHSFRSDFHTGSLSVGNACLYYSDRNDLRSRRSEDSGCIRNGDLLSSKYNFSMAVLNNKLYLCGGQEGRFTSNTVECYDLETDNSHFVESMQDFRCFPGTVTSGKHLYVLGGCSNSVVCNSVEKYDPDADVWVREPSMLTERCGMGCTTLNNKIYVCGGLHSFGTNGEKDELLASMEVYDILGETWSWLSAMRIPRFACSLVTYWGELYVIGGYDENDISIKTTDAYDPTNDEWKVGPSISDSIGFVQAVAVP